MPTGANTHLAPTNIINSVKGWNTRHIYNYYGTTNYIDFNYTSVVSSDYSQNLFQAIETYETSQSLTLYKGGYTFPPRYFQSGKDLRIKALLFADTDTYTSSLFHVNVGIDNTESGSILIGESNDGYSHIFGANVTRSAYLDIEIVCRGIETQDKPSRLRMMASGYVRYNTIRGSNNDPNNDVYLIPITPVSNILPTVDSDVESPVENTLNLNFSGSVGMKLISVINLSIEELE
jgi:hypothetical protein